MFRKLKYALLLFGVLIILWGMARWFKYSNGEQYKSINLAELNSNFEKWMTLPDEFQFTNFEKSNIQIFVKSIFNKVAEMPTTQVDSILILVHVIDSIFIPNNPIPENEIMDNIWQFYQEYIDNPSHVNCVHYSLLYHLLANFSNIPTRLISINDNGYNHIFAESYIKEYEKWVVIDIINEEVLPKTSALEIPLSAADIFMERNTYKNTALSSTLQSVDFLKYYSGNIYRFGHPFTFRNKVLRMLSWEDETFKLERGEIHNNGRH